MLFNKMHIMFFMKTRMTEFPAGFSVTDSPRTIEDRIRYAVFSDSSAADWDLQRFGAEDEGRTEDPSDRRQREEREKGNVPKSQDLPAAGVLIGTVAMLFLMGGYMIQEIMALFHQYFTMDFRRMHDLTQEDGKRLILGFFWETAKIVAPVMAVGVLMALAVNIMQVGLLFTLQPLEFKPERMKPDFKRILPNRKTMYSLGKILIQTVLLVGITYLVIIDDFIPMLKTAGMGLPQALTLFGKIAFKLMAIAGFVLLLLAVPDYFYQRFEYIENLKVTVAESKRERRDEEGDPMLRQRQRERANELRQQRDMLKDVPKADVIITNPTHFAVALEYDTDRSEAPIVTAKGADHMAFTIRTIAKAHGIPIEENPHLARMLYADVDIGQEIPDTLYRVISIIFSKLNRFKAKRI